MHKVLHQRDDIDRLYVSRRLGGRWLTSIKNSEEGTIQELEDYTKNETGKTSNCS